MLVPIAFPSGGVFQRWGAKLTTGPGLPWPRSSGV